MWQVWSGGGNLSSRLCECEVLVLLRHTYLGSFFLDPDDVRSLILGAICNIRKATGLVWFGHQIMGNKGPFLKSCVCPDRKGWNTITVLLVVFCSILFYSILFYSILFYSILFYSILFSTLAFIFKEKWHSLTTVIFKLEHGTFVGLEENNPFCISHQTFGGDRVHFWSEVCWDKLWSARI